jgi:hypothetical protein
VTPRRLTTFTTEQIFTNDLRRSRQSRSRAMCAPDLHSREASSYEAKTAREDTTRLPSLDLRAGNSHKERLCDATSTQASRVSASCSLARWSRRDATDFDLPRVPLTRQPVLYGESVPPRRASHRQARAVVYFMGLCFRAGPCLDRGRTCMFHIRLRPADRLGEWVPFDDATIRSCARTFSACGRRSSRRRDDRATDYLRGQ